jgi:hypothetical protein
MGIDDGFGLPAERTSESIVSQMPAAEAAGRMAVYLCLGKQSSACKVQGQAVQDSRKRNLEFNSAGIRGWEQSRHQSKRNQESQAMTCKHETIVSAAITILFLIVLAIMHFVFMVG